MLELIYDNHTINQRESDNYINLTQMCKATHKNLNDWTKTEDYKELISAISTDTNIFVSDLVQIKRGGTDQGTWGHPFVAIALAAWIDKSFYAWIIRHTFELITTGKTQLDEELEQKRLELARMIDKPYETIRDHINRLLQGGRKIEPIEAEIPTPGGLQGGRILNEKQMIDIIAKYKPSLFKQFAILGLRKFIHKTAGYQDDKLTEELEQKRLELAYI